MKFFAWTKKDGRVALVNVEQIVVAYEIGHETRVVLTNGEELLIALPLAQVHAQIETEPDRN